MLTPAAAAASEYRPTWRLKLWDDAFLAESVDEVDIGTPPFKIEIRFLAQGEKNCHVLEGVAARGLDGLQFRKYVTY
jgi:hypothetical protein